MKDFDIHEIDDVIHGRMRLGVMAFLIGAESADFPTLRGRLDATDGNLSVHLRKLEESGYVAIRKTFRDRKPRTVVSITPAGRKAFIAYLDSLSTLLGRN